MRIGETGLHVHFKNRYTCSWNQNYTSVIKMN